MDFFYTIVAFLTAGVAFITGLISLVSGLSKDGEKVDLVFGFLSLSIFLFLVFPPVGFIIEDRPPYSLMLVVKRIFIWNFYMMLPWFFSLYSGYRNRYISWTSNAIFVISFIIMVFTRPGHKSAYWVLLALIPFTLILVHGVLSSIFQMKKGEKREGKWLLFAMSFYGLLLFLGATNHLFTDFFINLLGSNTFFPFHLNLLAFTTIMSLRLRANSHEKYILQKRLNWERKRWESVVDTMHLIIVELDREGRIQFLNPFAVEILGFKNEYEAIGKNWFRSVVETEQQEVLQSIYADAIATGNLREDLIVGIKSKNGEIHKIKWAAVFSYDDRGELTGTINIGMDLTEQEAAEKQIRQLREQLEKESLPVNGHLLEEAKEDNIIGESEAILYAIQKARKVAGTNATVLLLGETGVGKELFAQMIHRHSLRNEKPFVKLNCAALPAELIESELFGHERGAFTGALQSRKGRFELADGGTIFLDEIGELPFSLQSKLLRVLQSREYEKVGGQKPQKVDVRIIAATNRDLQQEVKDGRFREDLYYRLNVFPLTIPALRSRKHDIPDLVAHFVNHFSHKLGKDIQNVSKADLTKLSEYPWPGNVREMENLIERSIINCDGPTLRFDWLINAAKAEIHDETSSFIDEVERKHVLRILEECHWRINGEGGAAEKLGLHPSTLRSRLKKMNITRTS